LKRLYLCPWESKEPGGSEAVPAEYTSIDVDVRRRGRIAESGSERRKRSLRERVSKSYGSKERKVEKLENINEKIRVDSMDEGTTVVELARQGGEIAQMAGRNNEQRKMYFLKLCFLTLLSIALMIDLVVINVKIFSREDWE